MKSHPRSSAPPKLFDMLYPMPNILLEGAFLLCVRLFLVEDRSGSKKYDAITVQHPLYGPTIASSF
jgi:hypothetical protein